MSGKIEAIIFDLGGVLVDFDHAIAAKKLARLANKDTREIYNLFFSSGLTVLFEEGKISAQDFFLKVKEMLGLKMNFAEFNALWNEIFFLTEKNLVAYTVAKKLKKNYKVALLSNVNIMHFEYLEKKFPVFDAFHAVFASFRLGLTKPDPLIYQKAVAELKVNGAENIFYTDDRQDLVEKACALGFKAYVFRGHQQLLRDLKEAGVTIE